MNVDVVFWSYVPLIPITLLLLLTTICSPSAEAAATVWDLTETLRAPVHELDVKYASFVHGLTSKILKNFDDLCSSLDV